MSARYPPPNIAGGPEESASAEDARAPSADRMSSIGTGYDQSTTTYSPDGRVFQIEYAAKAVDNSGTAVGIRCKDGVVMGVEKPKLSKMLVEGSNRRIFTVDKHSGMCVSGLMADARQVVTYAREEAAAYLVRASRPRYPEPRVPAPTPNSYPYR